MIDRPFDRRLVLEVIVELFDLSGACCQKPLDVRPRSELPILAAFVHVLALRAEVARRIEVKPTDGNVD